MYKRTLKYVLLGVTIATLTYLAGYYFSSKSEAFEVTKDFVHQSAIVKKEIGDITEITLTPFGYELEMSGDRGSAEFECKITGKEKSGKAHVTLIKRSSVWKIIHADLQIDQLKIQLIQAQ